MSRVALKVEGTVLSHRDVSVSFYTSNCHSHEAGYAPLSLFIADFFVRLLALIIAQSEETMGPRGSRLRVTDEPCTL